MQLLHGWLWRLNTIMYVKHLALCLTQSCVLFFYNPVSSFSYHIVLVFAFSLPRICWVFLFQTLNKALLKTLSLPLLLFLGKFTHFYLSRLPSKKLRVVLINPFLYHMCLINRQVFWVGLLSLTWCCWRLSHLMRVYQ